MPAPHGNGRGRKKKMPPPRGKCADLLSPGSVHGGPPGRLPREDIKQKKKVISIEIYRHRRWVSQEKGWREQREGRGVAPGLFLFCDLPRLKFRRSLPGSRETLSRVPDQGKCEILKIARILLLNTPVFSGKDGGKNVKFQKRVYQDPHFFGER